MTANKVVHCVAVLGLTLFLGCDDQNKKDPAHRNTNQDAATPSAAIKLSFIHASDNQVIPADHITRLTLIRYSQRQPAPGTNDVQYDKMSEHTLTASDYPNSTIRLDPGYYRVKHNSVYGKPPSGYYGQSEIVALEDDQTQEVTIVLHAAI